MSEPRKIRTTGDGCVLDLDILYLSKKGRVDYRVQTYEGPVTRTMVPLDVKGQRMLADVITGTLYDPTTGRSNSPHLTLIGIKK
jgi:hypothetical protein